MSIASKATIGALDGCEITWGSFDSFPRHTHDGLMLSVIDAGFQPVTCGGDTYTAKAGDAVAVGPGECHASPGLDGASWMFRSLVVPFALSRRLTGDSRECYRCDLSLRDPQLLAELEAFFQAVAARELLAMESSLTRVLERLFLHHRRERFVPPGSGREPLAAARARDLLAASAHRNVSLKELAQAAGIDSSRLTRAFTRHYGLPPHAWHLQFRLRNAQHCLLQGRTIADVAFEHGFSDQPHFSKAFKKLFGLTPARFAAQRGKLLAPTNGHRQ